MIDLAKVKQCIIQTAQCEKAKLSENRPSITFKMEVWTRSDGNNENRRYVFRLAGKEFEADDRSLGAVRDMSRVFSICCRELNEKRGYLVVAFEEPFFYEARDVFGLTTRSIDIVRGLTLMMKPCKEFRAL